MEGPERSPDAPETGGRSRWIWVAVFLALVGWQAWVTLSLFGQDQPWDQLLNDQPIISGRHPLHLYHGLLGAQTLFEQGRLCCYDPSFQAGYPKTPVFDDGSRPAELFLALGGGTYQPAAYKIGLASCCCLVPFLLALAAWGVGMSRGPLCLTVALGLVVWWSGPCRDMLEAGDLDLLLAGQASLVHVTLLIRMDRSPSFLVWLGLFASGCLAWFAQPLLFLVVACPLLLVYYLSAGVRHGLGWHVAFLLGLVGGVAVNWFWLVDWVSYWWIRVPLPFDVQYLPHRTFKAIWYGDFWGNAEDRIVALTLLCAGLPGLWFWNRGKNRVAARLLGLGATGLFVLAVLRIGWEPTGRLGTTKLLVSSLWFALLPAVYAGVEVSRILARWARSPLLAGLVVAALLGGIGWAAWPSAQALGMRCLTTTPLEIGLNSQQQAVVELLGRQTTPEARILWEDCSGQATFPRWTALLSLLTDRSFLGGLDPTAAVEFSFAGFVDRNLAGKPIKDWSAAELEDYCKRYNVGWIVCRSPEATARFRDWSMARQTGQFDEGGQAASLFTVDRPHSYVLKGQATWLQAGPRRIVLGEVDAPDGKVVLSLHYQKGLVASPRRVQIEPGPDPSDPIPLVRLIIPGPVTRITLTWCDR